MDIHFLRSLPSLLDEPLVAPAAGLVDQVLRACALAGLAPDLEVTLSTWAAVVDTEPEGELTHLLRAVLDAAGGAVPASGEAMLELLDALELLAEVEGCAWGEQAAA